LIIDTMHSPIYQINTAAHRPIIDYVYGMMSSWR
jgi:hypothetical protein